MVYGGSPLQDAGPSTTLLVRTMRSWAVSSSKPRILLAPWHSYNPMQGYEALWAEWHCQSEYCGARHDVQSRAGWPVRGYQSSPRPSNPSASIARPAGEPCYALLCPASAKSLSEKSREHVREQDRVSWLNPVSHTSSSEDVHRAQTRLQRSQKKVSLELVFQSKKMWSNEDCSLIRSSEKKHR